MQQFEATVGDNQSVVPIHWTQNLIGFSQQLHEKLHIVVWLLQYRKPP